MTTRIVVADDDPDIRRLVVFTLRRRGYEVSEAAAGDAALELIRAERPDLAILDVMMPGLTGLEVARAVSADPPTAHIPVILLSAKGQVAEIEEGLAAGARAYMVKPFAPQQLADKIAETLAAAASAPAPEPEPEPPAATAPEAAPSAPAPAEGLVRRMMVVDDDPDINRLVRTRLSARGFEVSSAANGEEALARLPEMRPDVLFLDVAMPGVGGLEVLEHVRSEGLDIAVVMMTAFGSEDVAIDALRRGADDYLRKPFEPREFQAVLDRTVHRLELTRQNAALREQLDEKRRQLEAELARAGQVQLDLLPQFVPELAGFEVAASFVPARDVGGDFYDWQTPAPGLLTLTVGDVMGKGMPAALLMATVRAAMRAVVRQSPPAAAMRFVAAALSDDLERSERFVTLFLAQLDVETRTLRYVDAGHGHALLRRADGRVQGLHSGGLPLGILATESYDEGVVALETGDVLLLYSDGLIDAKPDLELTPEAIAAQFDGQSSAQQIVERLQALTAQDTPQPDDLTVVALRCI